VSTLVYLGAGHGKAYPSGGYDPGAVSGSMVEEVNAEKVVAHAATALRRCGFAVEADVNAEQRSYVEAAARANAVHAAYAMEIHYNAGGGFGSEAYILTGATTRTRSIAERISRAVALACNHPDRGVKEQADHYFNRVTSMPSCILEVAFLDNAADRGMVLATGHHQRVGEAIASALCASFAIPYRPPVPVAPPTPPALSVDQRLAALESRVTKLEAR